MKSIVFIVAQPLRICPLNCNHLIIRLKDMLLPMYPADAYLSDLGENERTEVFVNEYDVNEYDANSDLQFHKDHTVTYEEIIIGISLLCDTAFRFRNTKHECESVVYLPQGSC